MKKFYCIILLLLLQYFSYSQVNRNISPLSFSLPENLLPEPTVTNLPEFKLAEAERQDKEDAKNNREPKISRSVYTNLALDNSGNWSELPNGDRVWRLSIRSGGAQALLPYFDQFYLPQGSYLHVYNADKTEVIGAFTSANNPPDGYYCTGLIHGDRCILEYYEPGSVRGKGMLHLNEVGHAYRWINDYLPLKSGPEADLLGFGQSASCEVNVNCSEGDNWQSQKRSVACIIIQGQDGQYLCSGALINNTSQDCTPYFLGADHCGLLSLPYQFGQWVFYFNYESPTCADPANQNGLTNDFIVGCVKVADSDDDGGSSGSDFLLLKLRQQIPLSYNSYFSGWVNTNYAAESGVGIHHPKGDITKISTFTSQVGSASWGGVAFNTHWQVAWATTANGHGVTEPGSSGSPLYDQQGFIVGHLTGGNSGCGGDSLLNLDYYGKISYDWTSDGLADTIQLKPWLDPKGTNMQSVNGINADCTTSGISTPVSSASTFHISPNPSTSFFNLDFGTGGDKTIRVFDALGRLVYETKTSLQHLGINLSQQAKGVYFITTGGLNEIATQKLVLE